MCNETQKKKRDAMNHQKSLGRKPFSESRSRFWTRTHRASFSNMERFPPDLGLSLSRSEQSDSDPAEAASFRFQQHKKQPKTNNPRPACRPRLPRLPLSL